MAATTHLKSLQALELAIRLGSLKSAAARLGITPAAVGQRIRELEAYLGTDLLVRGRSGLHPTSQLELALSDLQAAFAALDRVTDTLDFQRVTEIQVVADPDWTELWLMPRLAAFRETHPSILFCINGVGDIPVRLGAPDVRIFYGAGPDEPLYTDVLLPVSGPDNLRRFIGSDPGIPGRFVARDPMIPLEGMPLLHLRAQREEADRPGWVEWIESFGHRASGQDRGIRYQHARVALEAVRSEVGYLICGLSLVQRDLDQKLVFNLFPVAEHLVAPHPYRLRLRQDVERRPQVQRFLQWLRTEARETRRQIENLAS
jgi:LysR family glycine cleavage system transcriptional activator